MSFKKPFKAVPLKPRSRRSGLSSAVDLTAHGSPQKRRMVLQIGVAVAAGAGLGWALSGTEEVPSPPAQSFVDRGRQDRTEALRRAEAAEPPETLSGTMAVESDAQATEPVATDAEQSAVFYRACEDARFAGAAPLYRDSPGYRDALDRDGDGVACEPYVGR